MVVVTKLDRLGRSVMDLITSANDLSANGVTLEILSGSFNRDDPRGRRSLPSPRRSLSWSATWCVHVRLTDWRGPCPWPEG
jgi:hypothetical protein